MAGKEIKKDNMIPVTMEDLTEEQKQQVEQNMANFQKLCLESFGMTRQGPIQKTQFPKLVLFGESSRTSPESLPVKPLQDMVNEAIHHALINQSGVLVNTLHNLIEKTVDGSIVQEPT